MRRFAIVLLLCSGFVSAQPPDEGELSDPQDRPGPLTLEEVESRRTEADRFRDRRVDLMSKLLYRTFAPTQLFAIRNGTAIGLDKEQFSELREIGTVHPTGLMMALGYESPGDFYVPGDHDEFQERLDKLKPAFEAEHRRQAEAIRKILSEDQQARLNAMHFDYFLNRQPETALLIAGVDVDEEAQDYVRKLSERMDGAPLKRAMRDYVKKRFGRDIEDLSYEETPQTPTVRGIRYFGGLHPNLEGAPTPRRGKRCPICGTQFTPDDRGFQVGGACYHELCFVERVLQKDLPSKRTGKSNPRR